MKLGTKLTRVRALSGALNFSPRPCGECLRASRTQPLLHLQLHLSMPSSLATGEQAYSFIINEGMRQVKHRAEKLPHVKTPTANYESVETTRLAMSS